MIFHNSNVYLVKLRKIVIPKAFFDKFWLQNISESWNHTSQLSLSLAEAVWCEVDKNIYKTLNHGPRLIPSLIPQWFWAPNSFRTPISRCCLHRQPIASVFGRRTILTWMWGVCAKTQCSANSQRLHCSTLRGPTWQSHYFSTRILPKIGKGIVEFFVNLKYRGRMGMNGSRTIAHFERWCWRRLFLRRLVKVMVVLVVICHLTLFPLCLKWWYIEHLRCLIKLDSSVLRFLFSFHFWSSLR